MKKLTATLELGLWTAVCGMALSIQSPARAALAWDLAGDWNGSNPDGPWSYGGGVWKNNYGVPAYSIQPGHVSLSSDAPGNSFATWTSPFTGTIEVTGSFGSTPVSDGYGIGNNFSDRWVKENGVDVWHVYSGWTVDSFDLTLSVNTGDTVTFKVGSQGPFAGNTQTDVHISAVPEPGTAVAGLGGLGALAVASRRARRSGVHRAG